MSLHAGKQPRSPSQDEALRRHPAVPKGYASTHCIKQDLLNHMSAQGGGGDGTKVENALR